MVSMYKLVQIDGKTLFVGFRRGSFGSRALTQVCFFSFSLCLFVSLSLCCLLPVPGAGGIKYK